MRLVLTFGCVLALSACRCGSSSPASPASVADAGTGSDASDDSATGAADASAALRVTVRALVDLPRMKATQSLSGTAFDPATRTLFALPDKDPMIVPLVGNADFTAFTVGTPLPLTGRTDTAWDGEGLIRIDGGYMAVTVETEPRVERFDAAGKRTGVTTLPPHFAMQAPGNKGMESLALSPSGRFLFTANEAALTIDGLPPTKTRGTTIRILKRDLTTNQDIELAYRTEPLGAGGATGDMGVSELAALDDDTLLVLERGFQPDYGNTVRIFRVDLRTGAHVETTPALNDATPVLTKTLVVDIGTLPMGNATHPGAEPNAILDNYEALAIGPTLADGRRLLFVTSDDNASATQVPRVLVLAIEGL
ncbi:MAG: hypothetical protein JWO86_976 [Myxococcaceae bacterium]|nr:hypothetical protein [Myxococcaceae bacterium]